MNRYGQIAKTYNQEFLPNRYAELEDPTQFFQDLGEQIQSQVSTLTPEIAGPDQPGEDTWRRPAG